MSNNIFSSSFRQQRAKTALDKKDEWEETSFEEAFKEFEQKQKDFKEHSGLADVAAKAAEYKEVTPQMAGNNSPSEESEDQQSKTKKTKSDATGARSIADSNLDRIWGAESKPSDATGARRADVLPSLEDLLKGILAPKTSIDISIFNNDTEVDIVIAEKLGIKVEDIFEKGTQVGLSPLQIIDNLHIIRSSAALEMLTSDKLDSQDLSHLYIASLNNDTDAVGAILNNKNINLENGFTASDVLELSQSANTPIFKSVYLN